METRRSSIKILVVDDSRVVVNGFRRELEKSGFSVKAAVGGGEALELIRSEKFHIVFTDLVMPDINGVAVCREVKKISPETEVVLISGYPADVLMHLRDFLHAGGRDEILRKPLFDNELTKGAEKIINEIGEREGFLLPEDEEGREKAPSKSVALSGFLKGWVRLLNPAGYRNVFHCGG